MPLLNVTPPAYGYPLTNDDSPGSGTGYGTTITASGSTNTKGSWTTLGLTPTYDLYLHTVVLGNMDVSGASNQGLMDIGFGPDSSNVTTVVEDLLVGNAASLSVAMGRVYHLPFYVPAGATIFARLAASTSADTCQIMLLSQGGPDRPEGVPRVGLVQAIGTTAASSTGTTLTPGASGAAGAYAQLTASSSAAYIGITMAVTWTATTITNKGYTAGLGIGAATEQELGQCAIFGGNTSETIGSMSWPLWCDIPSGTRIAAKATCTGSIDSAYSAIAYGFVG